VAGWVLTRGRDRRDPVRAGLLLWGVWLIGAGVVLSSLRGISHSYYAVQLAPPIAGAVALGGALLQRRATSPAGRTAARRVLATIVGASALWSAALLLTRPAWPMAVALVAVAAAAVAVLGLLFPGAGRQPRVTSIAVVLALLSGPAAWSVATAGSVHRGANVHSGPGPSDVSTPVGFVPGSAAGLRLPIALADTVRSGAAGYDWGAAMVGRRAADLQLASGAPVWSLGGYNGDDPHPTLREFTAAVAAHRVHYLAVRGVPAIGGSPAAAIEHWAVRHGTARQWGPWSLIDLSALAAPPSAP
jgi:4-amino-4-deoxy-L-arabinose transferase-like glycosyltransferase